MRSCLKLTPRSSSENLRAAAHSEPCPTLRCLKSVSFCGEEEVEVFVADEWDRTPMEPSRKLTYDDVLELKSLQIELARANKFAYPDTCSAVPIGLLPLLPDSSQSSPASTPTTPSPTPSMSPTKAPPSPPSTPPRLPPPMPQALPRRKLNLVFMPLLDTPPTPPSPLLQSTSPLDEIKLSNISEDAEQSLPTPSSTPRPPEPDLVQGQSSPDLTVEGSSVDNPYFPSCSRASEPITISPRPIAQHKKFQLQGVDSSSLLTPSPFSLYPPSPKGSKPPKPLNEADFCWDPEVVEGDVSPDRSRGRLTSPPPRSGGSALGLTRMQVGPVRPPPPSLYPSSVTFKRRSPSRG